MNDLEEVIEYYTDPGEPKMMFIGHSWGAMYATWFINEHADFGGRVQGAVLSEPGAFTKKQLDDYFGRLIGSLNFFGEDVADLAWIPQFMTPADHERASDPATRDPLCTSRIELAA